MKNFTKFFIPVFCGAAALIGMDANAFQDDPAGCFAAEVINFNQGLQSNGNMVSENRSDEGMALGEPDRSNAPGGFVSLGIDGSITLQFSGAVYDTAGADIKVWETSFAGDACSGSSERAEVEVSQDGSNWISAGEVCRDGEIDIAGLGLFYVSQIRITDTTTSGGDGYDVDGVEALNGCQDFPGGEEGDDVCYGSEALNYFPGNTKSGNAIASNRMDPTQALGEPENDDTINFVSLGYGGEITIGFDGIVYNGPGDDLMVLETTFNNATFESYPESASVLVSQDGFQFYEIGINVTNEFASLDISNAPVFLPYITHVKVIDTTPAESQSEDGFDLDGVVALTGCNDNPNEETDVCNNYEMFYTDSRDGIIGSEIFGVEFIGNDAMLNSITTRDYSLHLSYDGTNNVLYAINSNGSALERIDPITGTSLGFIPLQGLNTVRCNVFYDGKVYLASENQDRIVEVNPMDGSYVNVATDVPVGGGDLVVSDGDLYLASRTGNQLLLIAGGSSSFVRTIPGGVNGLALTPSNDLLMANFGATAFNLFDGDGNLTATYNVMVNGELYTLENGDLAAGCNSLNISEPNDCDPELVNGGFELENTFSGPWKYVPQDEVPGWSTTSESGTIEIQKSGMVSGNASNSGDYHFELNGNGLNTLYQEVCSTPGTNLAIRFSHKKRSSGGIDKMELYLGGDLATIENNAAIPYIANANMEWNDNVFVYEVPEGQTSTIVYFKAISGTNNTVGNLLDDISVEVTLEQPTNLEELLALLSTQEQAISVSDIIMYPVPAKDRLNVTLNSQMGGPVSYEIVSVMGQSFNRGSVESYSGQTEINTDISNLADGTYFFVINMNGNTITKQFVKVTR